MDVLKMDIFKKTIGEEERGVKLTDRLDVFIRSRHNAFLQKRICAVLGVASIIISAVVYRFSGVWAFLPITVALMLLGNALLIDTRELDFDIQDTRNELELKAMKEVGKDVGRDLRAEKLFRFHRFEVLKYYDLTLRQSRWIFAVGVVCIVAGFVIISFTGYGLYHLYVTRGAEMLKAGILTGATGLLSAVLVEFIGKIYMDMYKKTVESLSTFHERLVTTHHLHFANFLVAKIETSKLREETLADFALKLAEGKAQGEVETKTPRVAPGKG